MLRPNNSSKLATMTSTTKENEANSVQVTSLFERIGGEEFIEAAVEEYNTRVHSDPDLARFFEGVDNRRLKRHERRFFTMAFSGKLPANVGQRLMRAHERLFVDMGLNAKHFDAVIYRHFVDTLKHLDVDAELVEESLAVLSPLRPVFEEGYQRHYVSKSTETEKEEEKKD